MKVLQREDSSTINKQQPKNFYILDYYLDGYFLKWEEVVERTWPASGETCSITLDDGTEIHPQVIETEKVSEDEVKIFLSSNGIKIISSGLHLDPCYL